MKDIAPFLIGDFLISYLSNPYIPNAYKINITDVKDISKNLPVLFTNDFITVAGVSIQAEAKTLF